MVGIMYHLLKMPFVLHPSGYCAWYNESSGGNLLIGTACPVCHKVAGHHFTCKFFKHEEQTGSNSRPKLYNATSLLWHKSQSIKFFTFTLPGATVESVCDCKVCRSGNNNERITAKGVFQTTATCELTGDLAVTAKFSMLLENISVNVKRNSGEKFSYVWVSEAQMKRQKKFGGIGDIHYHLVTDAYVDIRWLQAAWSNHTGHSKNSVDVQSIPKNVRSIPAYLVKYLGKGSQRFIYSRRFSCSRDLSSMVPVHMRFLPTDLVPISEKIITQPNGYETCLRYYNTSEIIERFGKVMHLEKDFKTKQSDRNFTASAIEGRKFKRDRVQRQQQYEQEQGLIPGLHQLF